MYLLTVFTAEIMLRHRLPELPDLERQPTPLQDSAMEDYDEHRFLPLKVNEVHQIDQILGRIPENNKEI